MGIFEKQPSPQDLHCPAVLIPLETKDGKKKKGLACRVGLLLTWLCDTCVQPHTRASAWAILSCENADALLQHYSGAPEMIKHHHPLTLETERVYPSWQAWKKTRLKAKSCQLSDDACPKPKADLGRYAGD